MVRHYPKLYWVFRSRRFRASMVEQHTGRHQSLAQGLSDFCLQAEYDMNFSAGELTPDAGASERKGCQFIWRNNNFSSFDDFLATFASRKRKNLLKERRRITGQGLKVSRFEGEGITPEMIDIFYHCYCDTYYRRRSHPYLTPGCFHQLRETMAVSMMLVLAAVEEGPCAAALCFFDDNALYGRYWGCLRDYDALHFEACYYQGIEFCIEKNLGMFNPHSGRTQDQPLASPRVHEAPLARIRNFTTLLADLREEAAYVRRICHCRLRKTARSGGIGLAVSSQLCYNPTRR